MAGLVSTIVFSIAQKASELAASNPAPSSPTPPPTAEQIKKFNEIAQVATQGLRDLGTWTQKTIPPVFGWGEEKKPPIEINIHRLELEAQVDIKAGSHQVTLQDPFSAKSWSARFNFIVNPFLWLNVYTDPQAKISTQVSIHGDYPLTHELEFSQPVQVQNISTDSSLLGLDPLDCHPTSLSFINGALYFIAGLTKEDQASAIKPINVNLTQLIARLAPDSPFTRVLKELKHNPGLTLNQVLPPLIDFISNTTSSASSANLRLINLEDDREILRSQWLEYFIRGGSINSKVILNDLKTSWLDLDLGSSLAVSAKMNEGQVSLSFQPNLIIENLEWAGIRIKGEIQSTPINHEEGTSALSGISLSFPKDLSSVSLNASLALDLTLELPKSGAYKIKGGFRYDGEIRLKDGFELQAGTNVLQLKNLGIQQKKDGQYLPWLSDFDLSLSDTQSVIQLGGLKIGNPAFDWQAQGVWANPEAPFNSTGHIALPIKDKSSFAGLKELVRGASVFYTLASFVNGKLSTLPGAEKANASYFYDVNAFSIDRVFDDLEVEINIPRLDYKVPQLRNKTLSLENLMFGFSSEGVQGRDHQLSFGFEKLSLNSRTQLENLELIFEVYEQNPWGKERTFDTQALTLRADCPKIRDCYDFKMTQGGVILVSSKEDLKKFVMSEHAFSFKSKRPRVGANLKLKNLIWLRNLKEKIYISSMDIESLKLDFAKGAIPFPLFRDKAGIFEWKDKNEIELDPEDLKTAIEAILEALVLDVEAHEVGRTL